MFWSSVLKSLLAVCVVTEFAVIFVESLTCESSSCINGDCQTSSTCEASSCFSETQELKMPELPTGLTLQKKGCPVGECTGLAFSATLGGQRTFRYDQQCCDGDKCNHTGMQPSQVPAKENGVWCLACYMEAGMPCIPTLLKCTGNETKCVSFIGTDAVSNNPLSVRVVGTGCATESACNLNMIVLESMHIHSFCSSRFSEPSTTTSAPDSTGLPPTSTSTVPVLISLLLLKVLF
ncbi:protein RoBo-1-like isoform X2 [Apodemus sylvaticus]|uniref:protein RoBo-1-like isoform X2 n=1 Tax=Apodemus sylvaticus TaxID=10129 RepID=UPI0022425D2F|nr:protein RoBo-1-like isoform X2 [Apodemus sylvaticus]